MDDYSFNEDDLINDYIADAGGPPPPDEYDDYEEVPSESNKQKRPINLNDDANISELVGGSHDEPNTPVPKFIETSSDPNEVPVSAPTSDSLIGVSWRTNDEDKIYGFERYAGLSSWRKTNTFASQDGAATMEATEWKKQSELDKEQKKREIEKDNTVLDMEDSNRNRNALKRGLSSSILMLGSGKGPDAQLTRFRELRDEEVLGRSWGKRRKIWDAFTGSKRYTLRSASILAESNGHPKEHPPPICDGGGVPVTIDKDIRVLVKRSQPRNLEPICRRVEDMTNDGDEERGLLSVPMSELIRRANKIEKRSVRRKLERETNNHQEEGTSSEERIETELRHSNSENIAQNGNEMALAEDVRPSDNNGLTNGKRNCHKIQFQQRLWVDKYAPTSILHLLSNERTNREVLRALRLWDSYVFKKDPPPRPTPAYPNYKNYRRSNDSAEISNKNKTKYRKTTGANNLNMKDAGKEEGFGGKIESQKLDVRPDIFSRVILLSGPPGVGKSTLAHIACRHAGYRPIEVNASDERSAATLRERVTRAMESATLVLNEKEKSNGKAGKPNCIILDEIDGVDAKASISALVDIIRAEIPSPAGGKGGSSKGKKGTRHRTTYLRRPIILICNHKHASALRTILPHTKQFDVQPPNPERLAARLRAVLTAENMSVVAGGMLLHRLVAATGGDIRSCLHTLQFASARARELAARKQDRFQEGGGAPTPVDISSSLMASLGHKGNGMKDTRSDLSSTITTVFLKEKSHHPRKRQRLSSDGSLNTNILVRSVDVVLKAVDHLGDNSKLLDCLFMNVNRVSFVDPTLDRCSVALEWLSGADTFRADNMGVASNNCTEYQHIQKLYIPSTAAVIHVLCGVETRPDLTFSTRPLSDLYYRYQANIALVHQFLDGLAPRLRRGVGGGIDTAVSDIIPYTLWLLSAGKGKCSLSRPVSSVDFLTSDEKLAFTAHVTTLRSLGLTYVKDEGVADDAKLEPEIDKLVKFEDLDDGSSFKRLNIPLPMKELLAHGATLAVLRQRERDIEPPDNGANKSNGKGKENMKHNGDNKAKISHKSVNEQTIGQSKRSGSNSQLAKNFLTIRAAKAKAAKAARRAAKAGFDRPRKAQTNTKFS